MKEILISENLSNQRLDKVLSKILKEAPSSFLYKMLRKKNITLNEKKATGKEITETGDRIRFFLSDETFLKMQGKTENLLPKIPKDFPEIPVLYEDADVCIFVKPQGVLSQKAEEKDFSVNEWIVAHAVSENRLDEDALRSFHPSVCNRLDRNTGGIMTAGLSIKGLQILSELFRSHDLVKKYFALVKGKVSEEKEIYSYLIKNQKTNQVRILDKKEEGAEEIHTKFAPVKYIQEEDETLLEVQLFTGKPHQIRAQLSFMGHPILGDSKYGDPDWNKKRNVFMQCLLSHYLEFPKCELPGISEKTFSLDVPDAWGEYIPGVQRK